MKKESPILFSTVMVQAILADRKTQTRRIVKPQPDPDSDGIGYRPIPPCLHWEEQYQEVWKPWLWETSEGESIAKFCPYGEEGDLLWVRETWCWDWKDYPERAEKYYFYKASTADNCLASGEKWKPSIHMPKEACRIWLEVTDVRAERLQDISEADAIAEGVWLDGTVFPNAYTVYSMPHWKAAKECYRDLWEIINGRETWQANPFCWVISFKVLSLTGRPASLPPL